MNGIENVEEKKYFHEENQDLHCPFCDQLDYTTHQMHEITAKCLIVPDRKYQGTIKYCFLFFILAHCPFVKYKKGCLRQYHH